MKPKYMKLSLEDYAKLSPWEKVKANQELEKWKKKNKKNGVGGVGWFRKAGDPNSNMIKSEGKKNSRKPMSKNQAKRDRRRRK